MPENKVILTVTLNPAIDRFVEIPVFLVGGDNRVGNGRSFPGGKGINVARAFKALGVKSLSTGFAGGANGQNLLRDLLIEGLEHNFVLIQGETRVNLTIREGKSGKLTRVIEAGPKIDAKDLSSFRDKFRRLASRSEWIVLSGRGIAGSPKGFYQELVAAGIEQGGKVIVDTNGQDLAFALKGKPSLVKINREEAQTLLGKKFKSDKELRAGLKKILELGAEHVIMTLGEEGAAASDGKIFYKVACPIIKGLNCVGCGDAVTAGFIFRYRKTDDFVEALVAGVAAGTANCLTEKPGDLRREEFERIILKVRVKVL